MKTGGRTVLVTILLASLVLLTGCFFNVFQTARLVGKGNVALTLGMAAMDVPGGGENNWLLTPQGRLAVGLTERVELGVQSGGMFSLRSGELEFLGVVGDARVSLIHEPEELSLAVGLGGGYSIGMLGWGLEGSIYLDSNMRYLPLYFVYRPLLPLEAGGMKLLHQFAGGLYLPLSEHARLLIEVDSWQGTISAGLGLDISL